MACAFLTALLCVRVLWSSRFARLIVDYPNERSLHERPTARTGGIGVLAGVGVAWLAFSGAALAPLVAIAGTLALFFLVEDARGLPLLLRFAAQLAAAAAFLATSGPYPLLLLPLLAMGIVWSANLYNFMDGSHGLAGGMTAIGFAALATAAMSAGAQDLAFLAAIVSAAAAGFLVWNFEPSRIFLGDTGSIPLGFLAAAIGIIGWQRDIWPFWFPLLVFLPFAFDATATLAGRILAGEKFWRPHYTHSYQLVIRMGWSHRRLALTAYALMLAVAATALALRAAPLSLVVPAIAFWLSVHAVLFLAVRRRWQRFDTTKARAPTP